MHERPEQQLRRAKGLPGDRQTKCAWGLIEKAQRPEQEKQLNTQVQMTLGFSWQKGLPTKYKTSHLDDPEKQVLRRLLGDAQKRASK